MKFGDRCKGCGRPMWRRDQRRKDAPEGWVGHYARGKCYHCHRNPDRPARMRAPKRCKDCDRELVPAAGPSRATQFTPARTAPRGDDQAVYGGLGRCRGCYRAYQRGLPPVGMGMKRTANRGKCYPCLVCGRMTRPAKKRAEDYPGTLSRVGGMCDTCRHSPEGKRLREERAKWVAWSAKRREEAKNRARAAQVKALMAQTGQKRPVPGPRTPRPVPTPR